MLQSRFLAYYEEIIMEPVNHIHLLRSYSETSTEAIGERSPFVKSPFKELNLCILTVVTCATEGVFCPGIVLASETPVLFLRLPFLSMCNVA